MKYTIFISKTNREADFHVTIQERGEIVDSIKYLDVIIDNKLKNLRKYVMVIRINPNITRHTAMQI